MKENKVKRTLEAGGTAIGCETTRLRSPEICRVFALAGFDFVFIDTEHATFDIETVADMITMSRLVDIVPIVRVNSSEYHLISRVLDAGALGIIVPRVSSVEEIERVVSYTKYPPVGVRGFGMTPDQVDFKHMDTVPFLEAAHREVLVTIQIERKVALDNIDAFVSVPGVDVVAMGWHDLSIDLGVPGEIDSPLVINGIQSVIDACNRHGKAPGLIHPDIDVVTYWAKQGMRWFSYGTDGRILMEGSKRAENEVRAAVTKAQA